MRVCWCVSPLPGSISVTDIMEAALAHYDTRPVLAESPKKSGDLRRFLANRSYFTSTTVEVATRACLFPLPPPPPASPPCPALIHMCVCLCDAGTFNSVPFLAVRDEHEATVHDAMLLLGQFGQKRLFVVSMPTPLCVCVWCHAGRVRVCACVGLCAPLCAFVCQCIRAL